MSKSTRKAKAKTSSAHAGERVVSAHELTWLASGFVVDGNLVADTVIHAPSRLDFVALCGKRVSGLRALPAMFGPIFDRQLPMRAMIEALGNMATGLAQLLGPHSKVAPCSSCEMNLQRMIVGDTRKLERHRGQGSGGVAAVRHNGTGITAPRASADPRQNRADARIAEDHGDDK